MTETEKIFSINRENNNLEIIIKNRKHTPTISWCIACIVIAIIAIPFILPGFFAGIGFGPMLFLLLVLGAMGMTIFFCYEMLMWQNHGIETILINSQNVKIIRTAKNVTKAKEYPINILENISATESEHDLGYRWTKYRPVSVSNFSSGRIIINSEDIKFRLGSGLERLEAEEIVRKIKEFAGE